MLQKAAAGQVRVGFGAGLNHAARARLCMWATGLAALPTGEAEAASLIGNGAEYLLGHFNAMREFYRGAFQRQLLALLWWD
ncbi:hypothetical protein ACH4D4_08835 [Streptomyces pristinaespiralis]|uniref:hypothetical protein n=1 Tax=Streptomyces pristinaespiralis TaxID=38300 RepID=UPI00378AFFA8